MVERFLEGNRKFIEENFSKDPDHYGKLATGQSPTALWIACSDSRVNPECITSARMGEIFVHRNIGNIVPHGDKNLGTVLEYAVNHLKVKDIVVCGHSPFIIDIAIQSDSSTKSASNKIRSGWISSIIRNKTEGF